MKLALAIIAFLTLTLANSCSKPTPATPSVPCPGVVPTKDLLTSKTWRMQKITYVQNNTFGYYTRGGSGNTFNYDNDAITFKADGTGIYKNTANVNFNITWQFADAEEKTINFTIANYANGTTAPGVNLAVIWEQLQVTSTNLRYAELYTNQNGTATMSSGRRVPVE